MTQTSYIPLEGGLDLTTPALKVKPGACIDSGNFVPDINGGYKRVGGYERFDGRPRPSVATYYVFTVDTSANVAVGDTITGATSASTAVVVAKTSTTLIVTKRSGAFTDTEDLQVGGVDKAVLSSQAQEGEPDLETHIGYLNLAAEEYRGDIAAVPGSGSILGVWVYDGNVYAFRNHTDGLSAKMWVATTSGWDEIVTGVTLNPDGAYEFVNWNFSGAAGGTKMYGVDGANKAFQWDGTTFTQITSGGSNTPSHIAVWRNRLFVSEAGSLLYSNAGAPTTGWTAGAGEIGTGDEITALLPLPGDNNTIALAVYGRNKTSILYGTTPSNWVMSLTSPEAGALTRTAQYVSAALVLDDRGVTSLAATDAFGNFAAASLSKAVQPFIDTRVGQATCSSVLRSQNHYILYFDDGSGLVFRVEGGTPKGVMPIFYDVPVICCVSGEDIGGEEVVFFGSTDGFVYQANVGRTFDGGDIEAWVRLAFNPEGGPTARKRWQRLLLEMKVEEYAAVNFAYEMDYGDFSIPIAAVALEEFAQSTEAPGGGGFWDAFTWDQFTWDSNYITPPKFDLTGSGYNISPIFFAKDKLSLPYTLQSVLIHFMSRRIER